MPEDNRRTLHQWEVVALVAAIVASVVAVLVWPEGRTLACKGAVDYVGRPYFCDCEATMTIVAFPYRASADGVSAADACLEGNPSSLVRGVSSAIEIVRAPHTAVCVDITVMHPRLEKGALVPVTTTIAVPGGLYQDPETHLVSFVRDPLARESDFITWENHLGLLGPGTMTRSRQRVFVIGGDVADWPRGHYIVTISNDGIATRKPIQAEFTVVEPR